MCSIYGAVTQHYINPSGSDGCSINLQILDSIRLEARDRGRDGGRREYYSNGLSHACLGNWRATPTPEVEKGRLQPYQALIHNGTIANDKELGPGEIDSESLAYHIGQDGRKNLETLTGRLRSVKGSYALACWNGETILAATNYKPLYYVTIGGVVYFSSMERHFKGVLPFGVSPVVLPPYTAIDFLGQTVRPIESVSTRRAVVIASGGLDSTVSAAKLISDGYDVCMLHFKYGCRAGDHEEISVKRVSDAMGIPCTIVDMDMPSITGANASSLYKGSPGETADGISAAEYAYQWVPARNLTFIAMAVAFAEGNDYHAVALGNNLEESGAYPDNEEEFTNILNKAISYAVKPHYDMKILSPIGNLMKHEIVKLGIRLNAPLELTRSCNRNGDSHCGQCGPCFMRQKAFERNGVKDPVFS